MTSTSPLILPRTMTRRQFQIAVSALANGYRRGTPEGAHGSPRKVLDWVALVEAELGEQGPHAPRLCRADGGKAPRNRGVHQFDNHVFT